MGAWGFDKGPKVGRGRVRLRLNWGFALMAAAVVGTIILVVTS